MDSEIRRFVLPNVGIANAGPVSIPFGKTDTDVGLRMIARIKLDVRILHPLWRILFDLMIEW